MVPVAPPVGPKVEVSLTIGNGGDEAGRVDKLSVPMGPVTVDPVPTDPFPVGLTAVPRDEENEISDETPVPVGIKTVKIESSVVVGAGAGNVRFERCHVESVDFVNVVGTLLEDDSEKEVVSVGAQLEIVWILIVPPSTIEVTS